MLKQLKNVLMLILVLYEYIHLEQLRKWLVIVYIYFLAITNQIT
jgi:hypothetical protein